MQLPCAAGFSNLLDRLQAWDGYPVLSTLLDRLPELQIYAAGGVVRDVLLNNFAPPKDFDFFLGGKSVDDALESLSKVGNLVHTPFGSPRWYPGVGNQCGYCDAIPIVGFRNGLWDCANIVDALNQFDFTANAVAFDLRTGEFFDPQNGRRDLLKRTMKAVRFDYPDEPISKSSSLTRNAVLWFRILHYATKLDFQIEPVTMRWVAANHSYFRHFDEFAAVFFRPQLGNLEFVI